jgi:hypothetical protein
VSDKALETTRSSDKVPLQTELKKVLCVESSKCSKAVRKREKSRIIKREKVAIRNSRTYILRAVEKKSLGERTQGVSQEKSPEKLTKDEEAHDNGTQAGRGHIDNYLTDIYLLYLLRGITGTTGTIETT